MAKDTHEGDFLVVLAVHCSLDARNLGVESVFLVVFEILVNLEFSCEEISLKLVEVRNVPTNIFFQRSVSEEVILRNDSNQLSEL